MPTHIKKYLFYLIPSLVIIALVVSLISFFEYDRYTSKTTALINQLDFNIDAAKQQMRENQNDMERMFTRFLDSPAIIDALKINNNDAILELFTTEKTVKPYIRSLTLLRPDGREQFYTFKDKNDDPDALAQKRRTEINAMLQYLKHKKKGESIYFTRDLTETVNKQYIPAYSRFIGENLYDQSGKLMGSIFIEIDIIYLVDKMLSTLPKQMLGLIITPNEHYLITNHQIKKDCSIQNNSDCIHNFDPQTLKVDAEGHNYINAQYVAKRILFLSGSNVDQQANKQADLLLVQYRDPTLLHRLSLFDMMLHSKLVLLTSLMTILFCIAGTLFLIKREQSIVKQYYTSRLSHAIIVISNFIERLHEYNDPITGSHIHRVAYYSELLATEYGLPKETVAQIKLYSSLHDIGKIAIPDAVLKKEGQLFDEEWNIMTQHVELGYQILLQFEISPIAEHIARYHHEKWNGSGYGQRLAGTAIPIEARIVSVADCYDALTTQRSYKKAFSHEKACAIINAEKGNAFDPEIIDIFNLHSDKMRHYRDLLHQNDPEESTESI